MKRTTLVEIKSVEREQNLLIKGFSEARFNLDSCSNELCHSVENSTVQTVPAWTGFSYLISPDDPHDCPDKVVYLLSINKSPIEMATYWDFLFRYGANTARLPAVT